MCDYILSPRSGRAPPWDTLTQQQRRAPAARLEEIEIARKADWRRRRVAVAPTVMRIHTLRLTRSNVLAAAAAISIAGTSTSTVLSETLQFLVYLSAFWYLVTI